MTIPTMLAQFLDDYGKTPDSMSKAELLEDALYIRSLDKAGEWWGFAAYSSEKSERAQRTELTRFINKMSA